MSPVSQFNLDRESDGQQGPASPPLTELIHALPKVLSSYYVHLLFLIILSVLGQVLHQWTLQWICQESMQKFWRNRHPPTGWNVGITLMSFDTRKGLFTKFWNGTHSSRIAENQFLYTCCKMLIVALPAISFPYQSKPTCPECF